MDNNQTNPGTAPVPLLEDGLDLDAAEKVVEVAGTELGHLCRARWEGGRAWENAWKWSIPAKPGEDTDLRIGDAIGLAKDLISKVRSLRESVASLTAQRDEALSNYNVMLANYVELAKLRKVEAGERDAMRAALEKIASTSRGRPDLSLPIEHRECLEIARAALSTPNPTKDGSHG